MDADSETNKISKLDKIRDDLSYSTGEPNVNLEELMTNRFILENTAFESWQNLLGAAGISDESDLEKATFNEFIKTHTRFKDWEEMLIHSANEFSTNSDG